MIPLPMLGLVAVVFTLCCFLPKRMVARLLKISSDCVVWIRLVGVLGVLWTALTAQVRYEVFDWNQEPGLLERMLTLKHYFSGAIVSLFVVIFVRERQIRNDLRHKRNQFEKP